MLSIPWEVHVPDEYVMAGNAAVLRCVVPGHCTERVDETDWFTDDDTSVFQFLGMFFSLLIFQLQATAAGKAERASES